MHSIEQDIINAVRNRKNLLTGKASSSSYARLHHLTGYRDSLKWDRGSGCFMYHLWGNLIFHRTGLHSITVSDCGYATPTTTSRLNAIFAALDIPITASVRKGSTVFFSPYIQQGEEIKDSVDLAGWHITIA